MNALRSHLLPVGGCRRVPAVVIAVAIAATLVVPGPVALPPSALNAASTAPDGDWVRQPLGHPSARADAVMARAASRPGGEPDRVVLFGGFDNQRGVLDDTWTWDGTTWTLQSPSTRPRARFVAAMAYHPTTARAVLFGGNTSAFGADFLADTWAWDGSNWSEVTPEAPGSPCRSENLGPLCKSPAPRANPALGQDVNGNLVLFGGDGMNGSAFRDTWIWNGTTWHEVTPEMPASPCRARAESSCTSPPARGFGASMTYHDSSVTEKLTVLFGGVDPNRGPDPEDTWAWDGASWRDVTPPKIDPDRCGEPDLPPCSPPGRFRAGMAFAPSLDLTVLFGGRSNGSPQRDTWTWDGATWSKSQTQNAPPPDTQNNGMAYWAPPSEASQLAEARPYVLVLSNAVAVSDIVQLDGVGVLDTWTWDGRTKGPVSLPDPHVPDTTWEITLELSDPDVPLPADGESKKTLTATLRFGGEPAADRNISFTTGGDMTLEPENCTTDPEGRCATTLRASLSPGLESILADATVVYDYISVLESEAETCSDDEAVPPRVHGEWWGNLDAEFGCHGRSFPRPLYEASGMAIQHNDGKVVVLAQPPGGGDGITYLMRYNVDGTLDGGPRDSTPEDGEFGSGGMARADGHSLVIQPEDGKIVTAGGERRFNNGPHLRRYNSNGTADNDFGNGGVASPGDVESIGRPVLQPDGKILVAGGHGPAPYTTAIPATVVRVNDDGSPDNGVPGEDRDPTDFFGPRGAGRVNVFFREDPVRNSVSAMAIQRDDGQDKIVLGGFWGQSVVGIFPVTYHWGLARLLPSGELDTTFNPGPCPDVDCNGKSTPVIDSNTELLTDLVVHDGKIVAVGTTYEGENNRLQLARFNQNGKADVDFNPCGPAPPPCGGKLSTNAGGNTQGVRVAVEESTGRIVVAGQSTQSEEPGGYLLGRFNPDGTFDETCGLPWKAFTRFAGSRRVNAMAVQRDGKIVVAGHGTILRFEGGGPSLFNRVRVNDVDVAEPTSGSTPATFEVRLDQPSCVPVSVDWATADIPGAADSAQAGRDYSRGSGTVTFAPGDTSEPVDVTVLGDTVPEPTERFFLELSNPRNDTLSTVGAVRPRDLIDSPVTLSDPQGTATITDAGPAVSVSDVTVTEPDSGSVPAPFTVKLNGKTDRDVSVTYTTENGTAVEPGDYTTRSGTLTIPRGDVSGTVEVPVVGDTVPEKTEEFGLRITSVAGAAAIADGEGTGTILDTDTAERPPPDPTLSVGDVRVSEGDADTAATLTVSLNRAPGHDVSVDYTTVAGSAEAGSDFVAASGTLAFGPDDQAKTVAVTIVGDQVPESTEELFVDLANPRGAVLDRGRGTITITDDDAPPPPPEEVVDPTERPRELTGGPAVPPPVAGATEVASTPSPVPAGPIAATAALAALPPLPSATSPPGVGLSLPPIPPPPSLLQLPVQQPATNAQSQFQSQIQVQQQAQAAAQAAFMAQRERQAEVESARTDRRDANPEGYLASARRRAPIPAAAVAWLGSLAAMGLSTVFASGGRQREAAVRRVRQR